MQSRMVVVCLCACAVPCRAVPPRRIAIHQAVVPTIDEADKEELEIDSIDTTPFAMFGVFDGHGGAACAEVSQVSSCGVVRCGAVGLSVRCSKCHRWCPFLVSTNLCGFLACPVLV